MSSKNKNYGMESYFILLSIQRGRKTKLEILDVFPYKPMSQLNKLLKSFHGDGLITSSTGTNGVDGRIRKYYKVTQKGVDLLSERIPQYWIMVETLK